MEIEMQMESYFVWRIVIKVTPLAGNVTLQVILSIGSGGTDKDVHFASNYVSTCSMCKSRYGAECRNNLSKWGKFRSCLKYSINTQLKN
jgi:hypothetical protein